MTNCDWCETYQLIWGTDCPTHDGQPDDTRLCPGCGDHLHDLDLHDHWLYDTVCGACCDDCDNE